MQHQHGFFTTHDGVKLYTQSWSSEQKHKSNLIVIHGYGEHCGRYANFAAWFVPLGCAIHTFDLRGHGKSPGQRGHIDAWSLHRDDVQAFVKDVITREPSIPTFLLGHSMGGLIVLDYGRHYSAGLRGIVSSAPALQQGESVSAVAMTLAKLIAPIFPRLKIDSGLDIHALSRDPAIVQAYQDDPLVHGWGTPRFVTEITRTMTRAHTHADEWPQDMPLLIVHGSADTLCPPAGSARFFANVSARDKTRYVYADYFHEVFNEIGRERVLADVQGWLAERLSG